MKVFLTIFTIIFILGINNVIADSLSEFSFPKPTGTHAVGTKFYYFIDKNRPDSYSSDPNDYRWISLQVDGNKFLQIQNNYVLQFFNKYLKDLPAPLLDGPSSKYPEVLFKSRIHNN